MTSVNMLVIASRSDTLPINQYFKKDEVFSYLHVKFTLICSQTILTHIKISVIFWCFVYRKIFYLNFLWSWPVNANLGKDNPICVCHMHYGSFWTGRKVQRFFFSSLFYTRDLLWIKMNLCFADKYRSMTYKNFYISPFILLTNFGSCETGICISRRVQNNASLSAFPKN